MEMFKNFLHNEMHISKYDIRQWIQESVEDVAKRMVANEYSSFNVKEMIKNEILQNESYWGAKGNNLSSNLEDKIAKILAKQIKMKLE